MSSAASRAFTLDRAIFNPNLYKGIQDLWLGQLPENAAVPNFDTVKRWFGLGASPEEKAAFDKQCGSQSLSALEAIGPSKYPLSGTGTVTENACSPLLPDITPAAGGSADAEATASYNALSLILLFDQMSRNIYRTPPGLGHVYTHYDTIALSLAKHVISSEPRLDLHPSVRLSPARRIWFYMPFMHSEDLANHDILTSIISELRTDLEKEGNTEAVEYIDNSVEFEDKHRRILEQFGRYPYRNEAVGRQTTEEERRWLGEGGETFGVSK